MKVRLLLLAIPILFCACQSSNVQNRNLVKDNEALNNALLHAQPGDEIIMANGQWRDISIKFYGKGTATKPIILKAETNGQVVIGGVSNLKLGGEHLQVIGLHFKNGYTPSKSVVEFGLNEDTVANHCRLTQCVIEDFNQDYRDRSDHWVLFRGRHNQMDHCYLAGKSNRGPTVMVELKGNQSIKNYHRIAYNHFGPRTPKGGPSGETIQLGNSFTSMAPSHTLVANNLFERCNGEVEVISSKSNFNEFRNNIFYKSEGSLVTRHGNYCVIDGNMFIGDESNPHIGGIRIIGSGHWITNNYFYALKGKNFRGPLAVMNGIPKSPLNRYIQVTDVVVAHNSWVNCQSPWQFGVGSNISQKDVLPASEIRSAIPIRTVVANNLIYNEGDVSDPIIAHDRLDGIDFQGNVINTKRIDSPAVNGLKAIKFTLNPWDNYPVTPENGVLTTLYSGFEFEKITKDLFGNSRKDHNNAGAVVKLPGQLKELMDKSKYGPQWSIAEPSDKKAQRLTINNAVEDLVSIIANAVDGDTLLLASGTYSVASSIIVDKAITIMAVNSELKTKVRYTGPKDTPLFEMHPKGELRLENLELKGEGSQYAFASLKEKMSSHYNLHVQNCTISGFEFVLKAFKATFAEHISFVESTLSNCNNGIELSAETNDKGDYNVENLTIDRCKFSKIDQNVIDYYRGGYDESTVGGSLKVYDSKFNQCGKKEKNGVLINTYGIINVDISNNSFNDNPVKLVALLWGAKNNKHKNNTLMNSGEIRTEENLKLKLMY